MAAALQSLAELFPAHDATFLARVLAARDGNLEATVEHLLGESVDADGVLARELLRQVAGEWEQASGKTVPPDVRDDPARLEAYLRGQTVRSRRASAAAPPAVRREASPSPLADTVRGLARRIGGAFATPRPTPRIKRYAAMTEPMLPSEEPPSTDRSVC